MLTATLLFSASQLLSPSASDQTYHEKISAVGRKAHDDQRSCKRRWVVGICAEAWKNVVHVVNVVCEWVTLCTSKAKDGKNGGHVNILSEHILTEVVKHASNVSIC